MRRRLSSGTLPEPRRILAWVYVGRVALATGIFAAAAWVWTEAPPTTTLAATLLTVSAYAFTAASFWYTHLHRAEPGRGYLYLQVLFDVAMVAAVVHLTGAKESSFAPLFVLVIVAGAVLLPFLGGILVGILASIVYFADVVASANTIDAGVVLQSVLFAAVALVTGFLGDRLRQAGTQLGEVETELRLLRLDTDEVLASLASGLLTVDGEGRLAYINPAAAELLEMPPDAWLGRPVLEELDRAAPGLGEVMRLTVQGREAVRRFETGERTDGSILGVSTTLLERSEGPSVTAIFQDITERRRMEVLRRRAERLEAVAELSASLAHEIKNPLASIRSATEQLTGDGMDAEDREVLQELVVRESDRLSRLLSEFLDFARVRVRAPGLLHVGGLVKHALDLVRAHPHAGGREVHMQVDDSAAGAVVQGDEDLLHRAVLNLALNAVQWAGPGGRVEVALDVVESEILSPALAYRQAVRIRVSDTGPGVATEDAEHVFDPFFTLRPGGTGLGLALVQRAAEAHGGAVYVDEPAAGWSSTFTLYLPEANGTGDSDAAEPKEEGSP
ncbi:MAG TPA: ATP-binding protein [Longimicrobiaceae bacterium]|nr:ATP-binding protein [Longimicrobiaceae bacterium]